MLRWLCGALLLASVMLGGLHADWDFSLISRRAQALYGPLGAGQQRIDDWQHLLASQKQLGELDQLNVVNQFFNKQLRYVEDIDLWQQVDYWQTPVEGLWKGAGDCEDYAIAKYFSLRHLGVSSDKLRITYVKALSLNRAHMVLTYYSYPEAEPLVLDSMVDPILPSSQRRDLTPVFSFNAQGVYVAGAQPSPVDRITRWSDLLARMRLEGFLP